LRSYTACLVRLTEPIYPILTALFAFGESPLSSPQRAGGYPLESLYEAGEAMRSHLNEAKKRFLGED